MSDFSNFQNDAFSKLNSILKNKALSKTEAIVMLQLNDKNFIDQYQNPNNEIVGTEAELKLVNDRAMYLEII